MMQRTTNPPTAPAILVVSFLWNCHSERLRYRPPIIIARSLRFVVSPREPPPAFVDEGLEAPELLEGIAVGGKPERGGDDREGIFVENVVEEEADDRTKVTGALARASGSRPIFLATVALKLPRCAMLATTLGNGREVTHCDVGEGPLRNSRPNRDLERVSNRARVNIRGWQVPRRDSLLSNVNRVTIVSPLGPCFRWDILTSHTRRIQARRWNVAPLIVQKKRTMGTNLYITVLQLHLRLSGSSLPGFE